MIVLVAITKFGVHAGTESEYTIYIYIYEY
jgi:hypothetical protein